MKTKRTASSCVRRLALRLGLALGLAALAAPPAAPQGMRVIHRNLAEMVDTAGTIVHGRVLGARVEPHPEYQGLLTVVVDVEIIELVKGHSGAPFSFRQYMLSPQDAAAAAQLFYKRGQEVILLIIPAHPQTRLSSPAGGIEQGVFRVAADEAGNRRVANGFNNSALFRGLDPGKDARLQALGAPARALVQEHRSGPLPLADFLSIVRALAVK